MLKILLGLEDYNELIYIQGFLRKIGFDVDGVQNEKKFGDAHLAFNPDVVLLSGLAKKGLGSRIAEKLKKREGRPRVVLLKGVETHLDPIFFKGSLIDKVLDRPIQATRLIEVLAKFGNIDPAVILDKYRKISNQMRAELGTIQIMELDSGSDTREVIEESNVQFPIKPEKIAIKGSRMSSQDRKDRFEKMMKTVEKTVQSRFDRQQINQITKALRQEEDSSQLSPLDQERREFVKALFSKKDE